MDFSIKDHSNGNVKSTLVNRTVSIQIDFILLIIKVNTLETCLQKDEYCG